MNSKKKIILMSCLVALLAVTAVFNFVLAGTQITSVTSQTSKPANYFSTYRSERTGTRSEELVQLDSVIALYDKGSEKYEQATSAKMKIVSMMENELALETKIKSLGFSDAVVSIGYDTNNVNVFINSSELNYDTSLSIYHMLKEDANVSAGNVIIMPVYASES